MEQNKARTTTDDWDHNARLIHRHQSQQGPDLDPSRLVSEHEKKGEISEQWYKYSKAAQRPGHPSDQPYKTSAVHTNITPEELLKQDQRHLDPPSQSRNEPDPQDSPKLPRRELSKDKPHDQHHQQEHSNAEKDSHSQTDAQSRPSHQHKASQSYDQPKKDLTKHEQQSNKQLQSHQDRKSESSSDRESNQKNREGKKEDDKEALAQGHDFPAAMQEAYNYSSSVLSSAYGAAAEATHAVKDSAVSAVQKGAQVLGLASDQAADQSKDSQTQQQPEHDAEQARSFTQVASDAATLVRDSAVTASQAVKDTAVSAMNKGADVLGLRAHDGAAPQRSEDEYWDDEELQQPSRISQVASGAAQMMKNTAVSVKDTAVSAVQKGATYLGLAADDSTSLRQSDSKALRGDQQDKHEPAHDKARRGSVPF